MLFKISDFSIFSYKLNHVFPHFPHFIPLCFPLFSPQVISLRAMASDFADSLLDALMGGLEFYVAILDSEKGLSGVDSKVSFLGG